MVYDQGGRDVVKWVVGGEVGTMRYHVGYLYLLAALFPVLENVACLAGRMVWVVLCHPLAQEHWQVVTEGCNKYSSWRVHADIQTREYIFKPSDASYYVMLGRL